MTKRTTPKTRLRAMTDADLDFLRILYGSTRAAELELVDWDLAQKQAFIAMQFHAQHTYYQHHYPDATYDVLELADGTTIGRLYLDTRPTELRIIDIALLPDYRGYGIGTYYLKQILHKAQTRKVAVRIHVERNNPALGLYQRLGFGVIEDKGVYLLMERLPATGTALQAATR